MLDFLFWEVKASALLWRALWRPRNKYIVIFHQKNIHSNFSCIFFSVFSIKPRIRIRNDQKCRIGSSLKPMWIRNIGWNPPDLKWPLTVPLSCVNHIVFCAPPFSCVNHTVFCAPPFPVWTTEQCGASSVRWWVCGPALWDDTAPLGRPPSAHTRGCASGTSPASARSCPPAYPHFQGKKKTIDSSVPDQPDPHVFGLPDAYPLVRGTVGAESLCRAESLCHNTCISYFRHLELR